MSSLRSRTHRTGDGKADILWQNDNGQPAIWTMDGFTQLGGSLIGDNPGSSWHVKGAGDFNGDGKADILWQHDTGQTAIWTMNGFTQAGGSLVGTNPGSSWHVLAMGS
jgi:serralysin